MKENIGLGNSEFKSNRELAEKIMDSAQKIYCSLNSLSKFHGKVDFDLSVIKDGIDVVRSKNINDKGEQDVNTISVNDLDINVYNAGKMDAPIAIGIAFGIGAIGYDEAEKLAHKYGCVSEYVENENTITDPFFKKEVTTLENHLLPPQYT